jgi:DNA-binding transcriptional ArsR family regulator
MLNILNESEISDKNKIAIIDTFCNTDKHLKQLTNLLRKTIGILEDCSKEYQYIEEFFYEYWSDFISKNDIIEHIEKYINVEWKRNPAGIVVTPVLAQPRMVSISIPDEEVVKPDVLRIGFLIDKNLRLRKKATTMEDIGNIMKVFGDKSKLDILNMIKDKPAYGKELADGLGLAKGTISHHMSSLMSIGVIDTLCESNRIYYSLNQKKFTEILEELKEYFVKPENR